MRRDRQNIPQKQRPVPRKRSPLPVSEPRPLTALTEPELVAIFRGLKQPAFRVTQLREFLYRRGISGYDQITNLSKALRQELAAVTPLYQLEPVECSEGDEATKWLWRAADGAAIESVQIRAPGRTTSCLSSQVGCAMGCVFCATGLSGYQRQLACHEMVEQYLQMWGRSHQGSSHIVFMGMGEPLHNYDEVLDAIRVFNAPPPNGCGVGARRITLSTVGLVPEILRLAKEKLQVELAVSLHAPDDATRETLIPVNKRYGIRQVMEAVRTFMRQTRRLVTFEYVLLAGVNDSTDQARELAGLLQELPCKVNLIPYNAVTSSGYKMPALEEQRRFKAILADAHIPVTIRYSKGRSIDAACGQLRRRVVEREAQRSVPENPSLPG